MPCNAVQRTRLDEIAPDGESSICSYSGRPLQGPTRCKRRCGAAQTANNTEEGAPIAAGYIVEVSTSGWTTAVAAPTEQPRQAGTSFGTRFGLSTACVGVTRLRLWLAGLLGQPSRQVECNPMNAERGEMATFSSAVPASAGSERVGHQKGEERRDKGMRVWALFTQLDRATKLTVGIWPWGAKSDPNPSSWLGRHKLWGIPSERPRQGNTELRPKDLASSFCAERRYATLSLAGGSSSV